MSRLPGVEAGLKSAIRGLPWRGVRLSLLPARAYFPQSAGYLAQATSRPWGLVRRWGRGRRSVHFKEVAMAGGPATGHGFVVEVDAEAIECLGLGVSGVFG